MKTLANKLLLLLYPKRCILCDELTKFGAETDICASCKEAVPLYAPPARFVLPTVYSELYRVYPAFRYEGTIREAVRRLKFQGIKENARSMAALMKQAAWPDGFAENIQAADFFVPVPLHKSRVRDRGFNQSGLLAQSLSEGYGVPMSEALSRIKKTGYMYGLTRTQRFENIRGAFSVNNPEAVRNKSIILIDDVYTTGATIEECARMLKKAGAGRICALTFAIADVDDTP